MTARRGFVRIAAALAFLVAAASACGGSDGGAAADGGGGTGGAGGGTGGAGGGTGGATGTGGSAACSSDPLKTGLVAQQTGVSVDAFDCEILKWTTHYSEPDAMIVKAIIYVESRFDKSSVACPNLPCGMPTGWTDAESRCYGLMQVVPACGGTPGNVGLLSNGHPDLGTATGSIFDPDVNIHVGIDGLHGNRAQEKQKFSGCTEDQYTLMAMGDYNSYGSTKSCTVYNSAYDNLVLDAYKKYATAAGYAAHAYP